MLRSLNMVGFEFTNSSTLFPECHDCQVVNKVRNILASNPQNLLTEKRGGNRAEILEGVKPGEGRLNVKCVGIGPRVAGICRVSMTITNQRSGIFEGQPVSQSQLTVFNASDVCPGRKADRERFRQKIGRILDGI